MPISATHHITFCRLEEFLRPQTFSIIIPLALARRTIEG
jgi:hypothetical protein